MSIGSTTAETGTARFSRHVRWTLAARATIALSSLLAGILIARWLGAPAVGVIASLSVMTMLAVTFGGLGLPSAITLIVARNRNKVLAVALNSVIFAFGAGCAIALGVAALAMAKPDVFGEIPAQFIMIAAAAIPFHMLTMFCSAIFLGVGKIGRYNLLDMISQSLLLVNPLIVVGLAGSGLLTLVLLNAGSAALLSGIFALVTFRVIKFGENGSAMRSDLSLMTEMIGHGSKFYIAMAAGLIIFRADLLIVNFFRGAAEAGVYAISTQAATLLMLVPNVISTVLFPRAAEAGEVGGEMTCRVTRHAVLIMLAVCLAAIPLALLLPFLYGPAFADVTFQVLILLPGVYLLGIETVQVQYFNGLGLPRAIPIFWVTAMTLNVMLNLALVPSFGAAAAALVSSGTYILMFILVAFYFRLQTGRSFSEAFLISRQELTGLFRAGIKLYASTEAKA